jgi:hypothetical protein
VTDFVAERATTSEDPQETWLPQILILSTATQPYETSDIHFQATTGPRLFMFQASQEQRLSHTR